ncbi:MAG: alpha/beta hydrolase-fold protein [Bacteroidota bacterium]
MHIKLPLFLLVFSFSYCLLPAQESGEYLIIGNKFKLQSEILQQERPYLIYLPDSYQESEKAYPVMYLLDGLGNFQHTSASVAFLARSKRIPEMIIVGIPNTDDRTRDLTPEAESMKGQFPTSGGADNMIAFIEKELMPTVEAEYRTNDYKLLVGHSFGGLFAIHTLIHHPGIFDSYLAISPSLWWDGQELATSQSKSFFESQDELVGHLYMTMGNEGGDMLGGAWKLAALFEEANMRDFHWEFKLMPEETHGSVPFLSTYEGLQFIFKEWQTHEMSEKVLTQGVKALEEYESRIAKLYGMKANWLEPQLLGMGQQMIVEGQAQLALPIFEKATELFPESSNTWFRYGEVLANLDQNTKAIEALKKSRSLAEDNFQSIALLQKLGEDVSDLLPQVVLSKKQLKAYAGEYKIEVGPTLSVSTEGGKLYAEADILPKEEIIPLGEDVFYVISRDSRISFKMVDEIAEEVLISTPDGSFMGKRK